MEMIVEEKQEMVVETSELNEPRWSVVSFDKCEAGGLTYQQAESKWPSG